MRCGFRTLPLLVTVTFPAVAVATCTKSFRSAFVMSLALCVCVLGALAALPPFCLASGLDIYPVRDGATAGSGDEEVTELFVGLIQSYDPNARDEQLDAVGTVVGTEIALDHINANQSMLPGYRLHYNFINAQVSLSYAMYAFTLHESS